MSYSTPSPANWTLYIIQSVPTGRLYTGITTDPTRRVKEHNGSSRGARYTRIGRPWKIVYLEPCGSQSDALRRERAVKRLGRKEKLSLVQRFSQVEKVNVTTEVE